MYPIVKYCIFFKDIMTHHTAFHALPLRGMISICAVSFFALLSGCRHETNELAHHHHDDAEESRQQSGDNHVEGEIVFDPHKAERFGVKVSEMQPGDFYETIAVDGRLDVSPSARATASARSNGILSLANGIKPGASVKAGQSLGNVSGRGMAGGDVNESARATMNAAKRELDRLAPLHADGIVSTRDYNAALQAYETAKAAVGANVSASGSAVSAPISGVITGVFANEGQGVGAGMPIVEISSGNSLVLTAYLPQRYAAEASALSGASFRAASSSDVLDITELNGARISAASAPVAVDGFIPVYFSLSNNGTLTAGTFCEVYLHTAKKDGVLSLPLSALSEQQGEMFCYVQIDDECYEKRPVTLGRSSGNRVEVVAGLTLGDKVVTDGVTFIRLAETSGVVPEGHSHNH